MPIKHLKLLLVEDSPHDAELTLLTLENSGLQVQSLQVHDHAGVARALGQQRFDVIVCDYLLPSSSGLEVLEVARELAPGTPFIFLSGLFGELQAVEMMRLGAVDYVLKQNLRMLPKAVKRAVLEVREREQRQAAETALEEVEARARLAIEAAEMGIWDVNVQTGEVIWDERCRALYELPPTALLTLDFILGRCHPEDADEVRRRVDSAINDGTAFSVDYRIALAGGRERWLHSNGRARFHAGECVRFTGVLQDIGDRKRATQELQQLNTDLGERVEQRTRERDRTWELSRELLGVLRFDMTPISFNPAWEATLGWSREQLGQLRLWELIHPQDIEATVQETESIACGNVSTRFVNRMRHTDGEYRWLSWTIVPENGLMYAAVRDITEERAVVDELATTNRQLRVQIDERERVEATLRQMQRLEVVGQLTAGVAHDFNNLLTVILTSTSLALRDMDRGLLERSAKRLQNVKEAGERGAKLTAQLLSFSRRQRLQPSAINLNATLDGMQDLLVRALGGSIWIDLSLAGDLWTALADPTQTEMIILNLAINARDAMAMGGSLWISTHNEVVSAPASRPEDPEPGEYVVFAIRDSGSGMSPETLKKAFEPFFTTKEIGKGSGLGLAQVFGFAKQSGGGVRIDTLLNAGTTVRVYLPKVEVAAVAAPEELPAAPTDGARKAHKVMLVDDDASVREVTAAMLESFGFKVVQAGSGVEAMTQLDEHIEVLVTDYAMPGMTGGELAGLVGEIFPQLPVVFITGYADIDVLGLEQARVVQKPFREQDLSARIWSALGR
jgi:PAS domain S-box-containing protein